MKVRALKTGYYGLSRRRAGQVFEIKPVKGKRHKMIVDKDGRSYQSQELEELILTEEEQFAKSWMERVDDDEPVDGEEDEFVEEAPKKKAKKKKAVAHKEEEAEASEDVI